LFVYRYDYNIQILLSKERFLLAYAMITANIEDK
jgi:hypothetical protein